MAQTAPSTGPTRAEGRPLRGKAATQARILRAASALFLEKGYERTTVAAVAKRAGVSRATVFWHFSDKPSLFREAFNAILVPFRNALGRDLSHLGPEKRLAEHVALYDDFVSERRGPIEAFVRWSVDHPEFRPWLVRSLMDLHRRYADALSDALAEVLPDGHHPDDVAMGLMAMLDGALLLSLFDPSEAERSARLRGVQAILAALPRRRNE